MNIFTIFFLQNFSKIFSKTHQIVSFLKIFSGEHAPEPPYQTRGFATRCMARSAMQIPPLLQKYFEPPPRNEILDTPLVELLILSLPVQLCEFVIMDRYCIVVALSISLELKVDSVALLS